MLRQSLPELWWLAGFNREGKGPAPIVKTFRKVFIPTVISVHQCVYIRSALGKHLGSIGSLLGVLANKRVNAIRLKMPR